MFMINGKKICIVENLTEQVNFYRTRIDVFSVFSNQIMIVEYYLTVAVQYILIITQEKDRNADSNRNKWEI